MQDFFQFQIMFYVKETYLLSVDTPVVVNSSQVSLCCGCCYHILVPVTVFIRIIVVISFWDGMVKEV